MPSDNETPGVETPAEDTTDESTQPLTSEDAPVSGPDPVDDLAATVTALQAELSDVRAKHELAEKNVLYIQAEFQNYRRRKEDEFVSQQKYAGAELLKNLLPIIDNFERAIKAAEQNQSYEKLIGGVQGTLKQILAYLEKAGVTPIEAVGKEFDPNFHEAIGQADESEYPANAVAEELQRGYVLHDRVLRPTLVKVSQG